MAASQHFSPRANPPLPAPGDGVTATWQYTLGSIVFIYIAFYSLLLMSLTRAELTQGLPAVAMLILFIACAGIQVRWCWFLRAGLGQGLPTRHWIYLLLAPAVAAWVLAFVFPERDLVLALPLWLAASLMATLLPSPRRWYLLGAAGVMTALPVLLHLAQGGSSLTEDALGPTLMFVFYAGFMPMMLFLSLWVWDVILRLDQSRHIAAELAVTLERLRFAADLHDIQGHHLQVIALKSELAERLLDRDPQLAANYLAEVRTIAKEAMEETRSLVAGLREVTLVDELTNASEVLELTGATCTLEVGTVPQDPHLNRVLALAVREATTNILRHANAATVRIALTPGPSGTTLKVTNDGLASQATTGQDRTHTTPGSGIAGLRGRVQAFGGTLVTTMKHEDDSFSLTMWVPTKGQE